MGPVTVHKGTGVLPHYLQDSGGPTSFLAWWQANRTNTCPFWLAEQEGGWALLTEAFGRTCLLASSQGVFPAKTHLLSLHHREVWAEAGEAFWATHSLRENAVIAPHPTGARQWYFRLNRWVPALPLGRTLG